MELHLIECQPYQQLLITQTAERVAKKRRLESGEDDPIQATIGDHLTPTRHARANELAALMIFQAGLPFNFFEKPEVIAFLRALNSAYIPPKTTFLKTTMLDNTWKAVKKEVDAEIKKEE
jgi:hypothetical protein